MKRGKPLQNRLTLLAILNCKTTMLDVIMKIPSILDRRVVQGASKLYARVTTAWFYSLGLLQIGVKKLTRNIESNFETQSRKNKFVHSSRENDEKSFTGSCIGVIYVTFRSHNRIQRVEWRQRGHDFTSLVSLQVGTETTRERDSISPASSLQFSSTV